jgi:hypothetical protein
MPKMQGHRLRMFYGSGLGVALACMSPSQAEPTSASTAETQLDDNQGLAELS